MKIKRRPQMRLLLWIGFGGLLTLLAFTAVSALSVLREVQIRNESIRTDFVQRAQILEELRSGIYISGTYVRDFLLEDNPVKAETYRQEFADTRQRVQQAIQEYQRIRHPDEAAVFEPLATGTTAYFNALQSAFQLSTGTQTAEGRTAMRNQVLVRRQTMISLADKAGEVNQRQMNVGNGRVRQLFGQSWRLLGVLFMLTLSIGILLTALSMRRMLSLEEKARQRYRDAEQARQEAQNLSAKLVDAQEEERRRVARELHDEIGQSLSALLVGIGNLLPFSKEPEAAQQVQIMRTLAERSVAAVRNMSLLLRPSMLDDLGLIPALQWQAREVSRDTGMRVSVVAEEVPEELPDEYRTSIFRIVQEALHNCRRHSQAQRVRIHLRQTAGKLLLSVQDDGLGFKPQDKGLGLLGIEERVHRLNGRFHITSADGSGTLLSIELPDDFGRPGASDR